MLKFRCFRRMNGFKNYRSFANSKTNLYLWGSGKSGSLGNGHSDDVPVPMKLEMPKNERFESISFGSLHTALLTKSGKVFTAGSNLNGQLGIGGTSEKVEAFQEVKNIEKITSIACGEKHTLALDIKGQAFSWGFGGSLFSAGALGTGQKQSHDTPTRVKQPEPFHSIAAGSLHSLALSKTGKVYAWGSSERGALGVLGSQSFFLSGLLSPTSIDYFARHKIERIFARSKVSAALTDDGKLFMWGSNDKHQLGVESVNVEIQSCENVPVHIEVDSEKYKLTIQKLGLSAKKCMAIN
ncbi:hypothetical protein MHBO_001192, partial [Bonamia ostreae]